MARITKGLLFGVLSVLLTVYGAAPAGANDDDRQQRDSIFISSDKEFNPSNGVRSGRGTASDPYVISGWQISSIRLKDTSAAVVIRDNVIEDQLVLNWNGGRVKVVDNKVGDLRVNENVRRTGDPTSGLIARNTFGVVGQLRHFDGIFEENTVTGERRGLQIPFFEDGQSVNFDGFNGSRFRNNKITGFVTMRLHGHHHSSGFSGDSHYHGADKHHDTSMLDHSKRYHRVLFTNNVITSPGPYALNYVDTAHSANDRTAASETNEELNKPHVHHTKVHMTNNRLIGSGLFVDIFNADDDRHTGTATGLLDIRNNKIELIQEGDKDPFEWEEPAGISIYRAKDVHVMIARNAVTNKDESDSAIGEQQVPFMYEEEISGIRLYDVKKGYVHIMKNSVASTDYGVWAADMPKTTQWWIHGLTTRNVPQDVFWDNSVANAPHQD